ncbi:MAG: hypothetical protein Q9M48_04155 [Rhodobacterales bacterium]|nr:hypothetical protein [Rhodobacterales bacterium]
MGTTEDLADALARDALAATKKTDDDTIIPEIDRILEASSSTMQEAFNTSMRVYVSEERARQFLNRRLKAFEDGTS